MKNPHAVALAKARAKALTAEQRSAIAKQGGIARHNALNPSQRKRIAKVGAKARWSK